MILKSLSLSDFRNYEALNIGLSKTQNLIFGENAQGKTNLLEAIFYLSCLKTFRGGRDADIIRRDCKTARVKGVFEAYGREIEVVCELTERGRKIFVNGILEKSPQKHIGLIKTVVFSPDDLQLIKEGPSFRRRFLNIAISQMRPSYIKALSEHNKIIESKRKILKMEEKEKFLDFYDVLNEKLSKVMAHITYERGEFLKTLTSLADDAMQKISHGRESLALSYNCDSAVSDTADSDNERKIHDHLKARKEAEILSGMCLVGSHRDDFTAFINGTSAREFGSQGQIRSAVLAIKVSEHEIIEKDCGEAPILLLDDVLSELDPLRREFLINDINRGQTVITGCDPSMFSELLHGKIFTVRNGSVAGEEEK